MQPAQAAVALVAPRVQCAPFAGGTYRATGLGEVPAIGEAALTRSRAHFREPQRRRVELLHGRAEVAHARRIEQLTSERRKLLQAHHADALPLDLLRSEQKRITDEMESAERLLCLAEANMQKVIVAREMSRPIRLLIANQPTRGLDVGSIEYIHNRIVEKRDQGTAILLVSPELDEVMELSDRIAVMYRGKIVAIVDADVATKEYIGLLMAGISPETLPPPTEKHAVEATL